MLAAVPGRTNVRVNPHDIHGLYIVKFRFIESRSYAPNISMLV